jgi:hypothetical protein
MIWEIASMADLKVQNLEKLRHKVMERKSVMRRPPYLETRRT